MPPPDTNPQTARYEGLKRLRTISGYKHIHWVNGYIKDGEERTYINDSPTTRADGMKRKIFDVLMISEAASLIDKSCDIELHHRRLTIKRIVRLIYMFDGQPS